MSNEIEPYMATKLISFRPDEDILQAMRVLLDRHFSGAPVVDETGRLVGVLSKKDCLAIVYNTAYHQDWGGKVADYMSREVEHLEVETSIINAAERFMNSSFRRFPVLRNGELVGQISRADILRAIDEVYIDSR